MYVYTFICFFSYLLSLRISISLFLLFSHHVQCALCEQRRCRDEFVTVFEYRASKRFDFLLQHPLHVYMYLLNVILFFFNNTCMSIWTGYDICISKRVPDDFKCLPWNSTTYALSFTSVFFSNFICLYHHQIYKCFRLHVSFFSVLLLWYALHLILSQFFFLWNITVSKWKKKKPFF